MLSLRNRELLNSLCFCCFRVRTIYKRCYLYRTMNCNLKSEPDYMKLLCSLRNAALASLIILFLPGCGKKDHPDPPMMRANIVLDTFTALENKEHKAALKKIARLREIDPGNVFLANLEILERNNSVLGDAQRKIDEEDIKGALDIVSEGIRKYGKHNDLVNAEKKLKVVVKIRELLEVFKSPHDSDQLRIAASQLKQIGAAYKPAAIFIPIADTQLKYAEKMHKWEMRRAVDGLCSDINTMQQENDPDVAILYAVLQIADPDNPVLLDYMDYLKGNEDIDLIIYPEEDIFADEDENDDARSPAENGEQDQSGKSGEEKEEDKKGGWWDKFTL